MENIKNTMTDENIEQVVDVLEDSRSEKTNILNDIIKEERVRENLEAVEMQVAINPETGEETNFIQSIMDEHDITLEDIENVDISDFENMKITKEMIENADIDDEDIPEDQIVDLLHFIEKYQSGEKMNIYSELPQFIKSKVDELYMQGGGASTLSRNEISKMVMDQMISEIKMDQALMDLNEAIKNELKIPTLSDLYTEFIKENFEEKLLEVADQVESENPEKAKMLRETSETYKKTYTFEVLREALNNRKVRQGIKDPSRYNKTCNKFNDKYINSRFKIASVKLCYDAIREAIPELTEDEIKKFIMLFCKTCENMNPDEINDHVFMYYTIQNIRLLQHNQNLLGDENGERSEMYNIIINNIKETIETIKEYEAKSSRK